jgi:hypothetical protein
LYLIKTSKINKDINELKIGVTPKVSIIEPNISNIDFIGKCVDKSCYDFDHFTNKLNSNNNLYFSNKKNILFIDIELNGYHGGLMYTINILKLLSNNYNVYFHPSTNIFNKCYDILMDNGIKILIFDDIINLNELNTFYFEYIFISRIDNSYYMDKLNTKFYNSTYILLTHDLIHLIDIKMNKNTELDIYNKFDKCIMISNEEINYLTNNSIDPNKLVYIPFIYPSKKNIYNSYSSKDIYFIGSEHPPNVEGMQVFLQYFLEILKIDPDIKLHIIGKSSKHFKNIKSVICHNCIDNIENIIKNIRLMVVPLVTGAGVKCKIIEAINYGIPIITTTKGVEGVVDVINDKNIFIRDFNEQYHIDFIKIYNNLDKLNEISVNAKNLFENNYALHNGDKYLIPRLFEKYNDIKIINNFKLKIILQIYNCNEKLIEKTINILTNLPLEIDVYIINNGNIHYNLNSNNKHVSIHYLKGDNTFGEWSAFNVYLNTYKNDLDNKSLYLFVNETIYKNYPLNIKECYNIQNLIKIYNEKLNCGHIDSFNENFQVLGKNINKWLRANFFILNYDTLCKLNFNLIFYNYYDVNASNLTNFLSENVIDKVFNFLNNKRYEKINKIYKIKFIINESLLSINLMNFGEIFDINKLNS